MFFRTSIISIVKKVAVKLRLASLNISINNLVVKELELKFQDIIKMQNNKAETLHAKVDQIIWFCWFQGIENAPVIVKKCYESVLLNIPDRWQMIIITEENYNTYTNIPDYILEKYEKGIISKTHFSDIIRFSLLSEQGGIWIDATILVLQKMDDQLLNNSLITLKSNNYEPYTSISKGLWTTFFIGLPKESISACFIRDCLYSYWKNEDKVFDYYLLDYIILLAYKKIPTFKFQLHELGCWGENRYIIKNILNKAVNEIDSNLIASDPIKIYKLNNKIMVKEYTIDGQETYFKKLIID